MIWKKIKNKGLTNYFDVPVFIYGVKIQMNKTEVAKNGNIVYLNSVIWYTMTGGIESTNQMIDEIADAIK